MKLSTIVFPIFAVGISLISHAARADKKPGPIPTLPWVHEGTVVTSHWYAAKLFTKNVTFSQDDNGNWQGSDGKTYSAEVHRNSDAGGFSQTMVLAIDGDQVLLKTTRFGSLMGGDPSRSAPDHGGEVRFLASATQNNFCESPDLLAKAVSDPQRHILVRRVAWPMGGQVIDAVRVDKISPAERLCIVYDRKTGMGLHLSSVSSTGADSGSILMEYDLVNHRDVQVPWANEAIPPAVKNLKSLRLAGRIVQEGPFAVRPTSLAIDLTADSAADKWMVFTSVGSAQLPGLGRTVAAAPVQKIYGSCEFGGLWIGPAAAAHLQQGQVLDEDPITKMKTVVSRIDNNEVAITQSNQSTTVTNTYDRSTGLLSGTDWFDAMTKFHTTMKREDVK
ncbi:MAG TPA: hypothetical protein VFE47_25180 [Tepidisphaeraceae bacterium]|jgi:hypothetical protein|nr:hypothetical protein [Tepidisphaeraceae bacterium]